MSRYNPQQPSFTTTTGGKNPKQIHIAHRRSPSELTNLMMEQIALQRQLEIVQQQQHQLLAHGSGGGNGMGSVSNNTHRRAQSSSMTGAMGSFAMPSSTVNSGNSGSKGNAAQGHLRRHSLGLNEAKRAAAQVQAQRAGKELPGTSNNDEDRSSMPPPSGFKFPPTLVEPPSMHSQQQGHQRSRSMASPQKQNPYQFPPRENTLSPSHHQQHERRQSGHYRSNSRSFDQQYNNNSNNNSNNNRTRQGRNHSQQFDNGKFLAPPGSNGGFVPGHRSRGSHGGGSISSISGFQSQSGRKSLFAPYLPQSSIPDLVADGRLVVGTLRVNKKNRSDAYVSTDGLLDADIFICGSKDRNRALEGDLVAVELLSVDEVWSSKREKEEKKRRKDNNNSSNGPSAGDIVDDVHNDASTHTSGATQASSSGAESKSESGLQRRGSLKQRPTLKKNDDVEVEGQSLLLVEEEEISDEYKPLYAGHVVAVIDRIPGQLFAGTLGLLRPSQQVKEQTQPVQRPKIVWFKPTDKKVPLIAIPTEQAPRDFVENVDKYLNKVFVASIKRWPITSLHPFGTLISELGVINDPKIEVDAILRDNNFLCEEYLDNDGVEREDFDLDDVDLDEEFAKRRDFTDEYVLAITETGEFSDHAIHVKRIDNEKIELGVHIADVTQYLREGSPLDKSARKRSSSVFLAQKTVHLLPKFLNDLVSFKKGEKNLSVSVAFEIDTATFEIDNVWIGESFVEPKNLLSFDDIDSIFANTDELGNISSASKDYVKTIALISREFKRQRLESSKLDSNVVLSLLDQVDDEKVRLDLNLFESSLCGSVLNEIFLKVNSTVAQRVYAILGDTAFLRRHPMPTLQKLETFKRKVTQMGFEIDTSSPASLVTSIINIEDKVSRECVEILLYKALSRSKYFIAGKVEPENYLSFYFNLPLYTHFTSPLRRYADIIVHRQLKKTLKGNGETIVVTDEDLESLKMTAEYCNFKKDCAKAAQDQSVHLLLCQTLNKIAHSTGQVIVMATVLQVYESAFDVFIPEFGIEKRVHGDQLPLKKAEFDNANSVLELYWEKGIDTATYIPDDEREPLSYRNSIKNKFKVGTNEIASKLQNSSSADDSVCEEFAKLKLTPPSIPEMKHKTLDDLFQNVPLRVEGDDLVQEIHELSQVPILLRAEIGMALPCLTVHAVNPFTNY
ncbi:mRNA-binding translational repressor SSD1 [Cyberlindnera jadinii NRRL Y-1542]|uniref:RNB-domain-containing protein n=1 Tax=Cyberlindnera jadinii (strain ATCC 18201 / CBS 1600 / BCRC 20928 / JCM 3617 / NBRC 0987 / NRRL Y-1542) TaxID=983966 RepID=A0A1E4RV47_CYBJN|nr:RNB-domain-containing protein [Cyberlindnera jadinii NRRL Y-1542]ODV71126.1 RNB-domain-containing protein [Cyberlindnera jadinii NRRL Y-1542]